MEDDAVSRNPRLDWQKAGPREVRRAEEGVEGRTGLESLFILESCGGRRGGGRDPIPK